MFCLKAVEQPPFRILVQLTVFEGCKLLIQRIKFIFFDIFLTINAGKGIMKVRLASFVPSKKTHYFTPVFWESQKSFYYSEKMNLLLL